MRFSRWITSRWNAHHAPAGNDTRDAQILSVSGFDDLTHAQIMKQREPLLDRAEKVFRGTTPSDMADLARIFDEFLDEVDQAAKKGDIRA